MLMLAQASAHALPLASESVQMCVTSPPYWGLRAYQGEQCFAWAGEPGHEHEWSETPPREAYVGRTRWQHVIPGTGVPQEAAAARLGRDTSPRRTRAADPDTWGTVTNGAWCVCGSWYGALGLEPTPELYVEHIVEVFREVRRVLRPNGTLWLNLGDSYAGSWGAQGRDGQMADRSIVSARQIEQSPRFKGGRTGSLERTPGLKPKDLVGIPWRVAFALQQDGWWLRSDIVWSKPNPMPESVRDRPTKAHEYVFLLSKAERYFYDADAIREPQVSGHPSGNGYKRAARLSFLDAAGPRGNDEQWEPSAAGRNARSVWEIATQPYPGAHFATYPERLAERCILAGSAAGDIVLDPFNGSGTSGRVALRHGRRYVGLDISREYLVEQSRTRIDRIQHEMGLGL